MNIIDQSRTDLHATSSHERFAVMDGLRGIAALAVVFVHSFANLKWNYNGQLAVDLFFVLSGFVISYSYEEKLRRSMRATDFLLSRFIRLYPMVLLGATGGIFIALIHNITNPVNAYPMDSLFSSGGLSLALLPYLSPEINDKVFSFNPPIWSLLFEVIANIIFIFTWRRLNAQVLSVLVFLGLAGVVYFGLPGGSTKDTLIAGAPRMTAGFFGGVLLFRLWSTGKLPRIRSNIFVLGAIMLTLFALPFRIGGLAYLPAFAILCLLVIASVNASKSGFDKISEFLGDVSYPVYLTHWLTLYIFTFIGAKIGLSGNLYVIVAILHLIAIPFIGFAVGHFYEKPVRLFIKSRLLRPRFGNFGVVRDNTETNRLFFKN